MANDGRPRQNPASGVQMARYVVYVDNQAKSSFDTQEAADQEANRISQKFPVVTVRVSDTAKDSVRTLGPTHEKVDAEQG